jgi:hypothetical protein
MEEPKPVKSPPENEKVLPEKTSDSPEGTRKAPDGFRTNDGETPQNERISGSPEGTQQQSVTKDIQDISSLMPDNATPSASGY